MERPLFGGALTGRLPPDAADMSMIREIPDHQEVFTHPHTDQSIIVEVLEYVQEPDHQALKTHFEELASRNDAASNEHNSVIGVDELDRQQLALQHYSKAYWLIGQQRVSKYNETARNDINIHMVLYRLPEFTTDLLATFNDPVSVNPDSSSHQAVATSVVPWTIEDMTNLVNSLTLLDTNLFG